MLLDSELLLLFEGLADQFALFPLVHGVGSLLVLLVEGRLLQHHLLVQVFLGLEDEHFAETLLVLLDPKPLLVVYLRFGHLKLLLRVHVQDRLVNGTHLRLVLLSKVHLRLLLCVDVGLSCFVEALEKFFVSNVLSLLVIETKLVILLILDFVVLVVRGF